jgi:alpha-ketoglutarate-dependent taurine dioxygenase
MIREETPPQMLEAEVPGRRAWDRGTVVPEDWTVPLPPEAVVELDAAVERLRRDPLPVVLLEPGQLGFAACARVMAEVRRRLREGVGLTVVDRVPVERYSADEAQAIGWLLGCLLGRPVAQKWNGAMSYDVRDTGRALDYGVRRSVTNLELQFHTDGAWLPLPAELVGLLCLNPARTGGVSRFVSLVSLHNEMRRRHPALLPRLYRAFCWDRQAEHPEGETRFTRHPVFAWDGQALFCRYFDGLIRNGQDLAGEALDAEGAEALAAARAVVEDPQLWVEFTIQRGQLQYLDNRQFAHSRTEFQDGDEPDRKRHMLRYWTREEGRRSFHA